MGCFRGYRKPKMESKHHHKECYYFLKCTNLDDYYPYVDQNGNMVYVDKYDFDFRAEYWKGTYNKTPDWSGEPQFYEKLSLDGKDIMFIKAREAARMRKDGIAR